MFRKRRNLMFFSSSCTRMPSIAPLISNSFFTNSQSQQLFINGCTVHKNILSSDPKEQVTQISIKNSNAEEADALFRNIYAVVIKPHNNCHLTIMTPTTLFDYDKRSKRSTSSRGYIYPGHIHTACTSEYGEIIEEGEASFSSTSQTIEKMMIPVEDSRLKGYQPDAISSCLGKFTSTFQEIRKWADLAETHHHYPITILVKTMSSEAQERYLEIVAERKKENAKKHYVLMPYYQSGTDIIMPANNCVSFFKDIHEEFFKIKLSLGDNPTTQTAYFELINTLCQESHKKFLQTVNLNDVLAKVHYQKAAEKFSFVI